MAKLSITLAAAAPLVLASACYTGVAGFDGAAEDAGPEETGASADSGGSGPAATTGGDADSDTSGDDGDDGEPFAPDPGQIRLLSAAEFSNTVYDLLGVEVEAALNYSDVGSGYDNSGNGLIDENLLSILYVESARVAAEYVESRLAADFTCYSPGPELTADCAEAIVQGLGRRAFRRPLTGEEREALLSFVAAAREEAADAAELAEALITRLLVSPRFLYRTEVGEVVGDDPTRAELTAYERASLLSYALVGSMPDAALLGDAEAGRLDAARTRGHVRRLLAGARGRGQLVRFFQQWLRVGELDAMAARPEDYPKFAAPAVAAGLRDEFAAYIDAVVVAEEGTFDALLTRELTFVNQHTAPLYGGAAAGDELAPLALTGEARGGVLTLASVMAVHASSAEVARDKPIRRGLLIKNQFQCEEIGLPSGIDVASAAENVMDQVDDFDALTTREQFELIMNQDELCMTCHKQFMPFGYLWSNFDALGQLQTHFGDRPLDAAVDDLSVDGTPQRFDGIMELVPVLADSPQAAACFSKNVARFATGRRESSAGRALSGALAAPLRDGDLTILGLFEEILVSPELYLREAPSQ
ncbi:MAG: DUF1592 domain-containing protein [Nannocystaceae bacterium]